MKQLTEEQADSNDIKTAFKRGYDMGVLQTTNKMKHNAKEVDLEKEIDDYVNEYFSECGDGVLISDASSTELTLLDVTSIARHFFELGLKTQKGE